MAYFVVCWRFALASLGVAAPPAALADMGDAFWLGRWRMFTDVRPTHTDLEAHALVGGNWVWVDLPTLYPSRWDEGPGYLRDDFYESEGRLRRLATDACGRLPSGAGPAERVRFTKVSWPKVLGQHDQPRDAATRTVLLEHGCGQAEHEAGHDGAERGRDGRGRGRGDRGPDGRAGGPR